MRSRQTPGSSPAWVDFIIVGVFGDAIVTAEVLDRRVVESDRRLSLTIFSLAR
jgi:hypothetical protein